MDTAVAAAVAATAIRLLDADHDTARGLVAPIVAAASGAEPLLWARVRSGGAPSPRLARWTSLGHGGTSAPTSSPRPPPGPR